MVSPPEDVVLERHPGPRRGSQIAGLEDEQALNILQCLCCCLLSLHISQKKGVAREGLEVLPQPVTPSQAGDLNVEGAERDTPHTRPPRNSLPSSLQLANSGLEPVLRESPLAKASAGAEFLEGPPKGQDLGCKMPLHGWL